MKHYTINVQSTTKHKSSWKEALWQNLHKILARLFGLSQLGWYGSRNSQLQWMDHVSDGPRPSRTKLSSRGAIRLESTQIRWFLWWPGGRLDLINGGQRRSKGELENNSRKLRDLLKNRHSDSLKRVIQVMMKKRDVAVVADDGDDKVWTSASWNHATATLCTEEFFLRTQFICISLPLYQQKGMGGGRI